MEESKAVDYGFLPDVRLCLIRRYVSDGNGFFASMLTAPSPENSQRLLRVQTGLVAFIAAIFLVASLSLGRSVLIPVALAVLLTFLLAPLVSFFQRTWLNRIGSVLVVVCLAGFLIAGVGWVVAAQLTGLAHDLRHNAEYRNTIKRKIADLRWAGKGGFLADLQATSDEIADELMPEPKSESASDAPPVVVQAEEESRFPQIQAIVGPLIEPVASAGLVIVLLIYMLLRYVDLRNRLVSLFGEGQLTITTKALADAAERISRYLRMQFIINGSFGAAIGIGLFLIGVPYAFLWGLLAGVLRYIPYVGPWIAAIFPIVISLVAFDGWIQPAMVIGLVVVCELISNLIMEPRLYGQSIGVSEVALLVASGFWAWLWGPIGLVLATPLTVCLVVLGRHVPALRPLAMLLGDKPSLDPPMRFYQRLLARDQEEAYELAEEYAKANSPESVYDDVLIPGLLLARQDRKDGQLSADDESFVFSAIGDIIQDLGGRESEDPQGESSDADSFQNEAGLAPPRPRVLACTAHHEAEELVLRMFRDVMAAEMDVQVIATRSTVADVARQVRGEQPAVVVVAVLPGGLRQARYLCQRLRKECPQLAIVVGYWGKKESYDKVLVGLRHAGVEHLTTSLAQTRSRIASLVDVDGLRQKSPMKPCPAVSPMGNGANADAIDDRKVVVRSASD